jgi:diadenosine tetraphosphate (Ap4A) HIT family hydrolase
VPLTSETVWEDHLCYVALVGGDDGARFPGFSRVVWRAHVKEMTDLSRSERSHLMRTVFAVEYAIRQVAKPDKINLASLGNQVPHLHWHVIPRWHDDSHFPSSIWSSNANSVATRTTAINIASLREAVFVAITEEQRV